MRRIVLFTLALAVFLPVAAWGPGVMTASADSGSNWTGEYFDNRNLAGSARFVRIDPVISFAWGTGSPVPHVIPADGFSVRWTGAQTFAGGTYTFIAVADDGVRVFVDDRPVIDAWYDQSQTQHTGQVTLTPGQHWVRVEYYDAIDIASVFVSWRPVDAGTPPGWEAAYFNNRDLAPPQVAGQLEPTLDHYWGVGSPFPGVVNTDNFSARWYGFPVLQGGTYTFVVGADDAVRVWVDDTQIINAWYPAPYTEHQASLTLNGGPHTIRVEYFEAGDVARTSFYWVFGGVGTGALPPESAAPPIPSVTVTVATGRLNVRSGPGVSHAVVTQIANGESYAAVGRNADGSWLQISGPGFTGWINARYVQISGDVLGLPVGEAGGGVSSVLMAQSSASMRVRRGPGTTHPRIAALNRGESAQVIGRTADSSWLQIRKSDGLEGWVAHNEFITLTGGGALASIPVTG